MKIGIENKKIYIETKDYDGFYMRTMPCQRFVTFGEAVRLKKELDNAIRNRIEDQKIELDLILSIGEIDDLRCELENQMDKSADRRSPVWHVLGNIIDQIEDKI